MVIPVVLVGHALVDYPSLITVSNFGALRGQFADKTTIAFKERIDDSCVSTSMWKAHFGTTYMFEILVRFCQK